MSVKRKRVALTLDQKISIINDIESGKKQTAVAATFGIAKTTVNTIWLDRDNIKRAYEESPAGSRKRMRTAAYEDVEAALLKWFQLARSQNIPIGGQLMREKAAMFAQKLKHESFQCSGGWLDRFKARHGVVFREICGEAAAVDDNIVTSWLEKTLAPMLSSYHPRDVFNADETGVFYRLLPDKTFCFKGDSCHGGKQSKERITAMVCANMDGSEKLPLMVIGKFERPRCFKNVKTLPATYKFNKKAWMTSVIFTEWLRKLDRQFTAQRRKILMLVDNCPAHPHLQNFTSINLMFLPPNATSRLQPCDMGIIKNLKVKYRKLVAMRLMESIENKTTYEINVLDAMRMLRKAWADVTQQTVANCFAKAGFQLSMCVNYAPDDATTGDDGDEFDEEDDLPLSRLLPADVTFDEYAAVDDNVETCEQPTDDDIVAAVTAPAEPASAAPSDEEEEEEEGDSTSLDLPGRPQAMEALDTLQRYLLSVSNSDDAQMSLLSVEQFLTSKGRCTTQMTLDNFLRKQ